MTDQPDNQKLVGWADYLVNLTIGYVEQS